MGTDRRTDGQQHQLNKSTIISPWSVTAYMSQETQILLRIKRVYYTIRLKSLTRT